MNFYEHHRGLIDFEIDERIMPFSKSQLSVVRLMAS